MNILLIEPNSVLAGQYADYLQSKGHRVALCSDAQGAILAADKKVPDLVIMEPLLTSHSGIEFLYEFRSYPEWQEVPVIILSRVQPTALGLSDKIRKELNITALYKPDITLEKLNAAAEKVAG